MITLLAALSCLLALVPAALFLRNLFLYRPLPAKPAGNARCSVLIPARNEERNLSAGLLSILQSAGIDFEVLVLNDDSSDGTAEIVQQFAATDARVRLLKGQPLPAGWCGKNFACQQLAEAARYPLLVFMDADVRVARSDSLARVAQFMNESDVALVSTVPRQETGTLGEKLLIPLIHFMLLGFLPLERMRRTTDPRFAAACGQLVATRRTAYEQSGGHAAVAGQMHDAMALARAFRQRGFATDLFDGTDAFTCRMYRRAADVWEGLAKNAHEGIGSSRLIVPATVFLLGGQVFPFLLLAAASSRLTTILAIVGTIAAWLPRCAAIIRFRQSTLGALLHPLGICALLAVQWSALARRLAGYRTAWKDRAYEPIAAA